VQGLCKVCAIWPELMQGLVGETCGRPSTTSSRKMKIENFCQLLYAECVPHGRALNVSDRIEGSFNFYSMPGSSRSPLGLPPFLPLTQLPWAFCSFFNIFSFVLSFLFYRCFSASLLIQKCDQTMVGTREETASCSLAPSPSTSTAPTLFTSLSSPFSFSSSNIRNTSTSPHQHLLLVSIASQSLSFGSSVAYFT